ncbi:hypothetical protein [Oscillibacter sp. 1-3]|uniref:hypothetical protein n=1 Tax=Oscillibacter sp. 1-3 TaxID=1235797 RepID=UPI00058FB685|nr:hypothetical protein [Oscillibacter sp. 1-3]
MPEKMVIFPKNSQKFREESRHGGGTGGIPHFGRGRFFLALTGGVDFSHDDGWAMHPPFSLFLRAEKEKTGRARSKREKDAGAEFGREGQIRPRYGGWPESVLS